MKLWEKKTTTPLKEALFSLKNDTIRPICIFGIVWIWSEKLANTWYSFSYFTYFHFLCKAGLSQQVMDIVMSSFPYSIYPKSSWHGVHATSLKRYINSNLVWTWPPQGLNIRKLNPVYARNKHTAVWFLKSNLG